MHEFVQFAQVEGRGRNHTLRLRDNKQKAVEAQESTPEPTRWRVARGLRKCSKAECERMTLDCRVPVDNGSFVVSRRAIDSNMLKLDELERTGPLVQMAAT